ncbi:PREDICTED: insulin-like peptide INSL6 [Chrysochloris asiatica]|uniref:Insulin-like peptide INSL6 n=1 Tax=Chrysochloris asiatica TaxID=185453 RepID=A0A9B0TLN5_CHRAS|nr:PREDICTED: insulin-like peptide INSL6 [Chrysochloris asiatica]
MQRPLCLCGLQLGLLLLLFSFELSGASRPKKLCGRHLLMAIIKLCGLEDWSNLEENIHHWQLVPRAVDAVGTFLPARLPSSRGSAGCRDSQPAPTAASMEGSTNGLEMQPLPECQHSKANFPPDATRDFSSPHINLYTQETVELTEKNSKIKTLNNLFWGNHLQRQRRGYSEKCCLKGCTKDELSIACFPYIDYKKLDIDHQI